MEKQLTPEQQALIPEYQKRWIDIGLTCGPADRPRAEAGIRKAYEQQGLVCPEIIWCLSPHAALVATAERSGVKDKKKFMQDHLRSFAYGSHDSSWVGFYFFYREVLGLEKETEQVVALAEIAMAKAGWWLPFDTACFCCETHDTLHLDAEGRLHNPAGPALTYRDGWKLYAIHGVRLSDGSWIDDPKTLTPTLIAAQENIEVRRVMIDRYGLAAYLKDSGAKVISEDKYGTLYKKEQKDDEDIVMVHVVNTTPEPDGTHKDYFLRVPPATKTAWEAVAWSFGIVDDPKTYNPTSES